MKVNSIILSQLNQTEQDLLNEQYTRNVVKIVTSELSLQQISEMIENLLII
ncbi:MAG: hypothetical protein ACREVX_03860 [Clostridium sp.]|uniref:hypothetical protein n=1 Tax=Clostridium sp. TaxID=1506 RepID=UPI003D6CA7B0